MFDITLTLAIIGALALTLGFMRLLDKLEGRR